MRRTPEATAVVFEPFESSMIDTVNGAKSFVVVKRCLGDRDPVTHVIGAYNPDGTIRTFFIPNDGERYFRRQSRR